MCKSSGIQLNEFIQGSADVFPSGPIEHTHYSHSSSDVLDIAVLKGVFKPFNIYTVNDLSSDHLPVILKFENIDVNIVRSYRISYDWKLFGELLPESTETLDNGTSNDNIDHRIAHITDSINDTLAKCSSTHNPRKADYLDLAPGIQRLITERNKFRRLWQRTHDTWAKRKYNRLTRIV